MPLLFTRHLSSTASFAVWQIAEPEAHFREGLPLAEAEEQELALLKTPLRRLEWLAGRWVLHLLTGATIRLPLAKDAFSKPFFPENRSLACSLSHSHGLVGALLVNHRPPGPSPEGRGDATPFPSGEGPGVGCDLQVLVEKMIRLAPKFLGTQEAVFVAQHPEAEQFDLTHLYWTAKESLYKAYGLKELDFRLHLHVENLAWNGRQGQATGRVEKENVHLNYRLEFEKMELPDTGAFVWTVCQGM